MAKKKKTRKRAVSKKKSARRSRGPSPSLAKATTAAIEQELERRERFLGELSDERNSLIDQLEAVEAEIAAYEAGKKVKAKRGRPRKNAAQRIGGTKKKAARRNGTKRKRPRNETNLVEALAKTLKNKTMSVMETAAAVQKAGYKTTSPNFRTIVNQTLLGYKKVFKKISRGQYTAA